MALPLLLQILVSLASVAVAARVVGILFKLLNQPPVIGEVIGGILLGPSCLASFAPDFAHSLIAQATMPYLNWIGRIGIALYMFSVGIELDVEVLKRTGKKVCIIAGASMILPFALGALLAVISFPYLAPSQISYFGFMLFICVAMSVTAFPVLARILTDMKLQRSSIGGLALTCAAIDDVSAWCLLAFVTGLLSSSLQTAFITVGLTAVYFVVMFWVVRPWLVRYFACYEKPDFKSFALCIVGLLVSALTTELIGIHALFGAFIFGAVMPFNSRSASQLITKLNPVVKLLLLPAFFAIVGLRTQIGLLSSPTDWMWCASIIFFASVGKFGGTYLGCKYSGLSRSRSTAMGILMNTRGLVELIVLNVGVELGVLTPKLFTMFVIMALTSTLLTGPLLKRSGLVEVFD